MGFLSWLFGKRNLPVLGESYCSDECVETAVAKIEEKVSSATQNLMCGVCNQPIKPSKAIIVYEPGYGLSSQWFFCCGRTSCVNVAKLGFASDECVVCAKRPQDNTEEPASKPAARRKKTPETKNREADPTSISFACSSCGAKLRVRLELAGKSVACPKCGKKGTVPAAPLSAGRSSALGLMDPGHVARKELDSAAALADRVIKIKPVGDNILLTSDGGASMELVTSIDRAISRAPQDVDLLLAKSAALCCALQFKTAEQVVDQVLAINPEHFQARQRKQHWAEWNHLLHYPPWSSASRTLHPVMHAHAQHQHPMQLVRDGLQPGIVIIRLVQSEMFPKPLSNNMRCKWEPVWSETPAGPLVAHYVLVEDNPDDPFKAESLLPIGVPDKVLPSSGHWLLQTLPHLRSCFCVLAIDDQVVYNRRYLFPEELLATLRSIAQKVRKHGARLDVQAFQEGVQWHTQNFDLKRVHF